MSRSYKKTPYITDGVAKHTSQRKKLANKKVRRNIKKLFKKGKNYKKIYDSYDIHDWISRWTWEEAKKEYETNPWPRWKEKYPTLKDFYNYWKKYYYRK